MAQNQLFATNKTEFAFANPVSKVQNATFVPMEHWPTSPIASKARLDTQNLFRAAIPTAILGPLAQMLGGEVNACARLNAEIQDFTER